MRSNASGFTLVELMISVTIIGVLSSLAVSSYQSYVERTQLIELAQKFKNFSDRVELDMQVLGSYPVDNHVDPPPNIWVPPDLWYSETELGGNFNWEGQDVYGYAGIAILGATAPESKIIQFDRMIDDGDITTGSFQRTANGRLTYILAGTP